MITRTIPERINNARAELFRRQTEKQENKKSPEAEFVNKPEGLLYFGNPHESIPVRLLQDKLLTAKAKFAWQIIKLNARAYQGTAFPSYDELQRILSDRPYSNEKASTKVVSQVLLLLRLCRWLTFCNTARDNHGRVLGNIYIIHDEPISIMDAIHFNDDYLAFVERACHHKDSIVNQAANQIMLSLLNDDSLSHYGSHIHLMRARYIHRNDNLALKTRQKLNRSNTELLEKTQENLLTSHTEICETDRKGSQKNADLQTFHTEDSKFSQTSHTEIRDNSLISDSLSLRKAANQYSTSTYINNNLYSTVLDNMINQFPQIYATLSDLEKNTLLKLGAEFTLSQDLFQNVLLETALRIQQTANTDRAVQNTVGYLCKMLRNAAEGQFKPYLIQHNMPKMPQPATSQVIQAENNNTAEATKMKAKKELTTEQLSQRLEMTNKIRNMLKQ